MIFIILALFAFGILNIIHHITIIEQLKAVKRNQLALLDVLETIDDDMITYNDELKDIKQSINSTRRTTDDSPTD